MPKTVDPILQAAMDNGINGEAFMLGKIWAEADLVISAQVTAYKLTGRTLDFTIYTGGMINDDSDRMSIERGLIINGVRYSNSSSKFFIQKKEIYETGFTSFSGTLLPPLKISTPGDDTYQNVITAVCTLFGKTAVFKSPSAAWLGYQFLPDGKTVIQNNAEGFFNLLQQKYLIHAADFENERILFYTPEAITTYDETINSTNKYSLQVQMSNKRNFMWRDESSVLHQTGEAYATQPIHNLGYLESTALPPSAAARGTANSCAKLSTFTFTPSFKRMDGDKLEIYGTDFVYRDQFQFEEIYPYKEGPAWAHILKSFVYLSNTEGGALPSTIERVAAYTPLVSTGFDGNLTPAVNNLQALAQAVDDMTVGGIPAHNDTTGLNTGDYRHLTAAEKTDLTDGGQTTLHKHRILLPVSVYAAISPISAASISPYAVLIDKNTTLIKLLYNVYVLTTNNTTNYWTINLRRLSDAQILNTLTTQTMAANVFEQKSSTSFSPSAGVTTAHFGVYLQVVKTGSPGDLYIPGMQLEADQ